ncbi:MAG: zinc ribbon domain-containing protein [candidate division NC10 bacterium]|nr:zinc ribbon domain-containing protein [candidate division NC10 bacterium]
MHCPGCGFPGPAGALSCGACGANLRGVAGPVAPQPLAPSPAAFGRDQDAAVLAALGLIPCPGCGSACAPGVSSCRACGKGCGGRIRA